MTTRQHAGGFSLVEVLVASSIVIVVLGVVFGAVGPAFGAFGVEPETADLQQRLRVAVDTLSRDLAGAGAGSGYGRYPGPLNDAVPAVLPFRQGRRNPDPPGTMRADAITIIGAGPSSPATTLAQPLAARSGTATVNADPGCRVADPACGFRVGMTVIVLNDAGAFDLFSVTGAAAAQLTLQHNMPDSALIYAAGVSRIVEVTARTYSLRHDEPTDAFQLLRYDGAGSGDVPVVDHVVDLAFEYFADPNPPALRKPLTEPAGPWTTYGPAPAAGANCVFSLDADGVPIPRLEMLGDGSSLIRLTPERLSDGPWCPDASSPGRYDADLLRVRAIAVSVRVEAAPAALRGVGPRFLRPGTSPSAARVVADQSVRFTIAPPNLRAMR